jgi:FkbM family methyltransferase
MLIHMKDVVSILTANNISISGVFHVGAHECEELPEYVNTLKVPAQDIIWVDAIQEKVAQSAKRGIPNVYNAVITDKDDQEVQFNISSNGQSSSILEFGTHAKDYPWCVYVDKRKQTSITVDSFFQRNNLDASKYNFWNFDIQGAELLALKGAPNSLKHAKVIYLEVNEQEVYKNCGLIDEIDRFLSQHNFKRVITEMTEQGWGDALYIIQ